MSNFSAEVALDISNKLKDKSIRSQDRAYMAGILSKILSSKHFFVGGSEGGGYCTEDTVARLPFKNICMSAIIRLPNGTYTDCFIHAEEANPSKWIKDQYAHGYISKTDYDIFHNHPSNPIEKYGLAIFTKVFPQKELFGSRFGIGVGNAITPFLTTMYICQEDTPFLHSIIATYVSAPSLIGRYESCGTTRSVFDELMPIVEIASNTLISNLLVGLARRNSDTHIAPNRKSIQRNMALLGKSQKPIFEISEIHPRKSHNSNGDGTGTHASPRQHDRRGHVRHYKSGKTIWVSPCKVGSLKNGIVSSSYVLD